jgi:hypothetical protein
LKKQMVRGFVSRGVVFGITQTNGITGRFAPK